MRITLPFFIGLALGVRYASQQVSQQGRKYLQSQRLRRFLGEYPGITTMRKPQLMHHKTYKALLNRLRHIEAKPEIRKYKSKRLTERTLKPTNMYQVEVAHIAMSRLGRVLTNAGIGLNIRPWLMNGRSRGS